MKYSRTGKGGSLAFTILEALIAITISSLVLTICAGFLLESGEIAFKAEEKMEINGDIRDLTAELLFLGRSADRFYVYSSYSSEVYAPSSGVFGETRLGDGQTGDFLLLVYEDSSAGTTSGYPIKELVGVYRDADSSNEGPVKIWRRSSITTSEEFLDPEEIVPTLSAVASVEGGAVSSILTVDTVVELAEGQANGKLFYNYKDKSVMVNGKIIHGNDAKLITDTYNLTIKPRGGHN